MRVPKAMHQAADISVSLKVKTQWKKKEIKKSLSRLNWMTKPLLETLLLLCTGWLTGFKAVTITQAQPN